ncbi:MAG: type II secretion system F family protein [Halobacteriales archaeon]|nr:type II secretion system F family protein [Halobacteriales archaeon]
MVSVIILVPLLFALSLFALLAFVPVSRPLERVFSRLGWVVFDGPNLSTNIERERTLRAAGIGEPYRLYQAKTLAYTSIAALAGVIIGGYATGGTIRVIGIEWLNGPVGQRFVTALPEFAQSFSAIHFLLLLAGGLTLGASAAGVMYVIRWQIPAIRADSRAREIDAGMPRMVAFVYALSRGGMPFPKVMETIADNRDVFGTGAEEFEVASRNINLFGADLVSSIRDISDRTPSEQFESFSENLTSVLQSGQDLSEFLHSEYERYREEAEERQQEILDVLATAAEIYVTVVVAGMLFLVTILLIMGLTTGGTLVPIRIITYLVLPALNVVFIAYLSDITQPLRGAASNRSRDHDSVGVDAIPDGGERTPIVRENVARLRIHRRIGRFRRFLADPVENIISRPELLLYVTVPLASLFVLVQAPSYLDPTASLTGGFLDVRTFDDALVQAVLFVIVTFGVVYEIGNRRVQSVASSLPDLLNRLASLNEAGLSIVASFERIRRSDMGKLDDEAKRIWRDIQWGAAVEEALERFETRVKTPSTTRVTTLLTNSMRASNEIGPVLRIAANQAHSDQQLKRRRQQETMTYLIVIYISFMVFLVVVGVIVLILIPNLPTAGAFSSEAAGSAPIQGITEEQKDAYALVFMHAGIVQSAMSGIVGGQMSEGTLRDGLKHASIMLLISYLVFRGIQWLGANGGLAQLTSAFGGA